MGALDAEEGLGAVGVLPGQPGAHHAGQRLRRLRDDLAVGDQGGDVAEDLIGEHRVVGRSQVGEFLRAEEEGEAGGAAAAEQPRDVLRRDGARIRR